VTRVSFTLHPFRAWHERPARIGRLSVDGPPGAALPVDWSHGEILQLLSSAPGAVWQASTGDEPPADLVAVRHVSGIHLALLSRRRALLVDVGTRGSAPIASLTRLASNANASVESLRRLRSTIEETTPVALGVWSPSELSQGRTGVGALTQRLLALQPNLDTRFDRTRLLSWCVEESARGRSLVLDPDPPERDVVTPTSSAFVRALAQDLDEDLSEVVEGSELARQRAAHFTLRLQQRNEQLVMRIALTEAARDAWLLGHAERPLRRLLAGLRRTKIEGTVRVVDLSRGLELCLFTIPGADPEAVARGLAETIRRVREAGDQLTA